MGDFGVVISNKNADVNQLDDVLFSTKYPTVKLDTSKPISFQNIRFTFNNDTPEPDGITNLYSRKKVYSSSHGYKYKPSFWSLIKVEKPPVSNFYQQYFQEQGVISAQTVDDEATFYVDVDKDNVNFYVRKYFVDGLGSSNPLNGTVLRIRLYIFAEDLSI